MDAVDVKSHMEETEEFLSGVSKRLASYQNEYNVKIIMEEDRGARTNKDYIQNVFKQVRRLEVMCDEALDRVRNLLRTNQFAQLSAEKTLFRIYHTCILEFFSPRNDVWYEESRAVYTSQASIRFRNNPPLSLKKLFAELEPGFQNMRETLDYYDNKYQANFM